MPNVSSPGSFRQHQLSRGRRLDSQHFRICHTSDHTTIVSAWSCWVIRRHQRHFDNTSFLAAAGWIGNFFNLSYIYHTGTAFEAPGFVILVAGAPGVRRRLSARSVTSAAVAACPARAHTVQCAVVSCMYAVCTDCARCELPIIG